MSNFEISKKLVFTSSQLNRDRFVVEKEKIDTSFPQFSFFRHEGSLAVKGILKTNYGNQYKVRILISSDYPYTIPTVKFVNTTMDPDCPHKYTDNSLCVMHPNEWSSRFSLAFIIAKTAIWLNKYDYWQKYDNWPGNEIEH